MTSEIQNDLARIADHLLFQSVLLSFIAIGVLALLANPLIVRLFYFFRDLRALNAMFSVKAEKLQEEGKYRELLRLATEQLKTRQSNITAKWYRAVSLYRLGHHEEALSEFLYLQRKQPAGLEDILEEYIGNLRARVDSGDKS